MRQTHNGLIVFGVCRHASRIPQYDPYMLARILASCMLGVASTFAVSTLLLCRFDENNAHCTISRASETADRNWRPSSDSTSPIIELKCKSSPGVLQYHASADRFLTSCFGGWEIAVDTREPIDAVPEHLRRHLIVSWPKSTPASAPNRVFSDPRTREQAHKSVLISGWPLLALWTQTSYDKLWNPTPHWGIYLGSFTADSVSGPQRREIIVPLHPVWPAFLVNSAIYAALWATVLFIPMTIIRSLRSRRSLCRKCRYDLRHTPPHSPCPECGVSQHGTLRTT